MWRCASSRARIGELKTEKKKKKKGMLNSNLSRGLVDEMRMVEEVVMMEREVVVGGLQSPGLR